MKHLIALILLFGSCLSLASAQIANPVKWSYEAKKIGDKKYEVIVTALIDPQWHIYAQDAGEGPEPTSFVFTSNPLLTLDGKVKEIGNLEKSYDPNFKSTLKFYSNKVTFIQKVKVKSSASTVFKGTITYMVCNNNKCLPPKDLPFSVKLENK
jgi:thiol:disulfide interchange protein DsbD